MIFISVLIDVAWMYCIAWNYMTFTNDQATGEFNLETTVKKVIVVLSVFNMFLKVWGFIFDIHNITRSACATEPTNSRK